MGLEDTWGLRTGYCYLPMEPLGDGCRVLKSAFHRFDPKLTWRGPDVLRVGTSLYPGLLTVRTKGDYEQKRNASTGYPQALNRRMFAMVRLARESLAFASVASFVWMVCTVAGLMG